MINNPVLSYLYMSKSVFNNIYLHIFKKQWQDVFLLHSGWCHMHYISEKSRLTHLCYNHNTSCHFIAPRTVIESLRRPRRICQAVISYQTVWLQFALQTAERHNKVINSINRSKSNKSVVRNLVTSRTVFADDDKD